MTPRPDRNVFPPATDLHVHAGLERAGRSLADFERALAARGVLRAGLVDHAECYYPSAFYPGFTAYVEELQRVAPWPYPRTTDGLRRFFREARAGHPDRTLTIACGLEIGDCARVPDAFLALPDYFLNCSSMLRLEPGLTFAVRLAARMRRFSARVRDAGKPAIVAHPFRELYRERAARTAEGDASSPAQFLPPSEIRRIVDAAGEGGLFLEVNEGCLGDAPEDGPVADLAVHAVGRLAEAGARLSFGSDSHEPPGPVLAPALTRVLRECDLKAAHFAAVGRAIFGPAEPPSCAPGG